jgi:hypothetical protein
VKIEVQIVEFTGWTLEYLDRLDIERLFPFYFELVHSKTAPAKNRAKRKLIYADQADWL